MNSPIESVISAPSHGRVPGASTSSDSPPTGAPKQNTDRRKKRSKSAKPLVPWQRYLLRASIPLLILLAWQLMSQVDTMSLYVTGPKEAFARFFTDYFSGDPARLFLGESTWAHFFPSVSRALVGLLVAAVLGVGVGLVLGLSPVATALFQPLVHLGRSLPSPALLGVFFLLFGTGDMPKIFLIAFSVIWPILLNTMDGVRSVGTIRSQAAAVFKIPGRDVLLHIVLPGAAPKIFAGLRTSLSLSLIIMIISELQKSENGLGYLLIQSQRTFDYSEFWAVLIVLVMLGVTLNLIFLFIERRALAWHRGVTQQND